MPIPNVATLYQKINKGAEGGHEFARIMNQLLLAEARQMAHQIVVYSDALGDYKGVDCILKIPAHQLGLYYGGPKLVGIQYKFFPSNFKSEHKRSIIYSLENALMLFPEMHEWVLITPEDPTRNDLEWLATIKEKYGTKLSKINFYQQRIEGLIRIAGYNEGGVLIENHGHSYIISLMLRHEEVGKRYYEQEFFKNEQTRITLSKILVDSKTINWRVGVNEEYFQNLADRTSALNILVLEFYFLNNSDQTHLLFNIDIVVEEIWVLVKGIKRKEILKSLGTIEWNMDFSKENSIDLIETIGGPIIFKNRDPKRFSLQLNNFVKNCPGNMAKMHFIFHFDSMLLISKSYTFDF